MPQDWQRRCVIAGAKWQRDSLAVDGLTGHLTIAADGHVLRDLMWAQIRKRRAATAELTARCDGRAFAAVAYLTTFSCGRGRPSSAAGGFGGDGGGCGPRSASENTMPSPVSRA